MRGKKKWRVQEYFPSCILTPVRKAPNVACLLSSTHLLWAEREASSRAPRVIGLPVLVPLRMTVETATAPGRPRREREFLILGFVNRRL